MEFTMELDYDHVVREQLNNCGKRCASFYDNNKELIEKLLEQEIQNLPIIFVTDRPDLGNKYAEIINYPCFEGLCLSCCYPIVQLYKVNMILKDPTIPREDLVSVLLRRMTHVSSNSLC